jgi:hypothetical protein
MPPVASLPILSKTKTDDILRNTTVAAGALRDMSESSRVPFLSSVSAISFSILTIVQVRAISFFNCFLWFAETKKNVRVNKQECLRMVESIQVLLWTVVDLCVNSETGEVLPPSMLNNIANFSLFVSFILNFIRHSN